jgi:hypothetical protein
MKIILLDRQKAKGTFHSSAVSGPAWYLDPRIRWNNLQ